VFFNLHTDVCADEYGCVDCADYRTLSTGRICQDTDSCVVYIYDNVVKIHAREVGRKRERERERGRERERKKNARCFSRSPAAFADESLRAIERCHDSAVSRSPALLSRRAEPSSPSAIAGDGSIDDELRGHGCPRCFCAICEEGE